MSKPSHTCGTQGDSVVCHSVAKLTMKGRCKYCHTTHRNWWEMSGEDYGRPDIILCGLCKHTMIRKYAEVE